MTMLSANQLADIVGCNSRTINRYVKSGKLNAIEILNDTNLKKNMFVISDLPEDIQEKYALSKYKDEDFKEESEIYTSDERAEMSLWIEIIKDWRSYRAFNEDMSAFDIDEAFVSKISLEHRDVTISRDILYRKYKAYIENNLDELIDKRGKSNRGRTKITDEMRGAYLYYFLQEVRHPMYRCYKYMKMSIAENFPEQSSKIPSERSFRRDLMRNLPKDLQVLGRFGRKAYDDMCGFYTKRDYSTMNSNDYWIGDTHTLDIQSINDNGKIHRLYLSAWSDARSGVIVGWHIGNSASSDSTLMALRNGILKHGIPTNVYVDNGREFLNKDIGGLGHRARKKKKEDVFIPPPIFSRLGINMVNAKVKNARAKIIERTFLDVKNQISRLFETFTGGNILERPEMLKAKIKNGDVVLDSVLKDEINTIIEYYFNLEDYGGAVTSDRGLSKIEVYNKNLKRVRKAGKEDLHLLMLRNSRPLKVGRRGLSLKISGDVYEYSSAKLKEILLDKYVYYRYDTEDLSHIRVYDSEDRFIMKVPCINDTILEYGASKEDIKRVNKMINDEFKNTKSKLNAIKGLGYKSAKELVLAQALRNKENPIEPASPKIIDLVMANEEEYPLLKTVGEIGGVNLNLDLDTGISIDRMLKNIKKRKGKMEG